MTTNTVPNLTERAMLVNLSISQWTAVKNDKKVNREVSQNHGNDESMGRFNKSLVAKSALEKITKIASAARVEHYRRTLPWRDGGDRVLSSAGYFDYMQAMRKFQDDWEPAIAEFFSGYPAYVQDAKSKLNGLFDAADYPSESKIREKYSLSIDVMPMPTSEDFRVNLGTVETEKIRQQITADSQAMLARAMADIWQRMRDVVSKLVERLKIYEQTPDGKVKNPFRDTLVTNITDLLDILPSLNVTEDQTITKFAADLRKELTAYTPDQLRESETLRADISSRADEILSKMSAFLA